MLLEYLARPLNAYRHEALVKRLFKGAEAANLDDVMGAFLVAMDRSIRRERRRRHSLKSKYFKTRAEADAEAARWVAEGFQTPYIQTLNNGTAHASASVAYDVIVEPGNSTMPRPKGDRAKRNETPADYYRQHLEKKCRLFTPRTRRYLRRRAWRCFRKAAKADAARYRAAARAYLVRYVDGDADSDIHLLDNWGLVHTLFHHSPALIRPAKGWDFAPGKSLADLTPAPYRPEAWRNAPADLLGLLTGAGCRAVRQWAAFLLRADHAAWLVRRPVAELLALTDHADADVAALGFEALERHPDLASVSVDAWLARLDGDDLDKLQRLGRLLETRLDPWRVSLAEAVKLAAHRSRPVARLGLTLLRGRGRIAPVDVALVLRLVQAECSSLRADVVGWLRGELARFAGPRAEWVLDFLDSKHSDVRAAGWTWLVSTPLKDDPTIWHRLLESPYDDVKGPLVAALAERASGADDDVVRLLWGGVLLNIHRGGRLKPGVVAQVVRRLTEKPDEAPKLLPLLAVAVRSLRGPEFRAGLAGVVAVLERHPDLRPAVATQFPELVAN